MKPLLYLEYRLLVNSLKNILRSPKRLIVALFVAAFIFAWFSQTMILVAGAPRPSQLGFKLPGGGLHLQEMITSAIFLLLCTGTIVLLFQAFSTGSLIFSLAHIDFLFPTPIPRRSVLLLKLLRDYLKYILWIGFFLTLSGAPLMVALGGSFYPYGLVSIAGLAAYLLFVLNITHTINIIFTFGFERFKQAGLLIKTILIVALLSAFVVGLWHFVDTGSADFSLRDAARSPLVRTVFAPTDWCTAVILTPVKSVGKANVEFDKLALLVALAVGSFFILLSRKENIYEPSLGISVKSAQMRMAMRSGDATAIRVQALQAKGTKSARMLYLPPFGRGTTALLWKNLLVRYRMSWGQLILVVVLPVALVLAVQRSVPYVQLLQNLPYLLVYMAFLLSITVQPQVRAELKHVNLLKAMPISAWKVVLAQILTGTVYLAAGILFFTATMWIFIPATRTALLPACALVSVFLGFNCVSASIIPALLYPNMRDQAQNFFSQLIGLSLIMVALIPSVVLGVALGVLVDLPLYKIVIPICAVNFILGIASASVSGAIFRRFDPSGD